MMYPFLQIDGDTEIVHSDMLPNGEVKVYIEYIEKTDAKDGFHHAACFLPAYRWENVDGFTPEEIARYQEVIESTVHLILEFARQGGFYVHVAEGTPSAMRQKCGLQRRGSVCYATTTPKSRTVSYGIFCGSLKPVAVKS